MTSTLTYSTTFLLLCYLLWHGATSQPQNFLVRHTVDSVVDSLVSVLRLSSSQSSSSLSCFIAQASWRHPSASAPSPVFVPKKDCLPQGSSTLCDQLVGKRLLFVGPDTTYHLHLLWLKTLEALDRRSHTCLGRDYCTFHHVCRPPVAGHADYSEELGRKKKLPGRSALLATNSSILQYSLSTNLYASKDKKDPAYNLPQIDPLTDIRVSNTYWLGRAHKADIIVLHRGPIEAPAWTYYTSHDSGNWSFTQLLCKDKNYLAPLACEASLEHLLVNAALHATFKSFLPSLLRTLYTVSEGQRVRSSLLVWHGSWYIQPPCAIAGLPNDFILVRDVWSNINNQVFVDPWSLYYNVQVYIHDRLLKQILQHFNITYLPMAFPAYAGDPHVRFARAHEEFSTSHVKDCILNPWPTFGEDVLERSFFSALSAVLSLSTHVT